jgi:hypothetical protein
VDQVAAIAAQRRGQGEAAFSRFRAALLSRFPESNPAREHVQDLLQAGEAFYAARESERGAAQQQAMEEHPGQPPAVIERIARETIVTEKVRQLVTLAQMPHRDMAAIARIQAEILWFEPDAYSSRAAVDLALGSQTVVRAGADTIRSRIASLTIELESARQSPIPDPIAIRQIEEQISWLQYQLETGNIPRDLREAALAQHAERFSGRPTEAISSVPDSAEQLQRSAAAASENLGMLELHTREALAAGDYSAAVKAAAKYGGRILFSGLMAGRGWSPRRGTVGRFAHWVSTGRLPGPRFRDTHATVEIDEARTVIHMFSESRWSIEFENNPPDQIVLDLLAVYADSHGMGSGVARDHGRVVAINDTVRESFVAFMKRWAGNYVMSLQQQAATTPSTLETE